MITTVQSNPVPAWHAVLLALLPAVRNQARFASRGMRWEARQEFIAEVVANVTAAVARLAERGRIEVAKATPLAQYAIRQARQGRLTGGKLNRRDVSSRYCRHMNGICVERLDRFDPVAGEWREAIVEDHHTPVADQVAFRLDFPEWLARLSGRDRQIAEFLAVGNAPWEAAVKFGLCRARISQKRAHFACSWQRFHTGLLV
jgi:hypothetical protein